MHFFRLFSLLCLTLITWSSLCGQSTSAIYLLGEAQGTTYHITYYDPFDRDFQYSIDSLLLEFDLSVSTYHPNSVISRVNRNDTTVILDETFIYCFNKAKEIWKITNGAFDPTVYPLVNAWGFGPGKKQHIEQQLIDSILTFVGFDKIELVNGKIIKQDKRVGLDFNAFAQGYSVDVVTKFLTDRGVKDCIVEIGGEVFATGKSDPTHSWIVGIEKPIDNKTNKNELLSGLLLENKGVATSGDYRRFTVENGVKYAHHLDPKTGYPTKNTMLSATVVSPTCVISDATATALLVMGLKKTKKYLKKHPEIQVFIIYSSKSGDYSYFKTDEMDHLLIQLEKQKGTE